MKVYQIISESRLTPYLNILDRVVPTEIDKALGYLARLVGHSRLTAAEIAESWAAAAKKTKLPLEDIMIMGEYELRAVGVDDALIKAALKEADKYEAGIFARINKRLDKIGAKADDVKAVFGGGMEALTTITYKLGIYAPMVECGYNVLVEYRDYKSGKQDYAGFQNSAQHWVNKCVGQVAAAGIGSWGIAKIVGFFGTVPGPLGMKMLGPIYQTINQTAQIAFNTWLLSPLGREALAQAIVADIFMNVPVNVAGNIEMQPIQKVLRDTIGGWTTKFIGLARDQVQKVTNPEAVAQRDKEKAAADQAHANKKYPSVTPGWQYDATGKPKLPTGPDNF
jgi:hypothetical protein